MLHHSSREQEQLECTTSCREQKAFVLHIRSCEQNHLGCTIAAVSRKQVLHHSSCEQGVVGLHHSSCEQGTLGMYRYHTADICMNQFDSDTATLSRKL